MVSANSLYANPLFLCGGSIIFGLGRGSLADKVIIVMGVSGSGKSSIGGALADALGTCFVEGDDHHPVENRTKMAAGIPLTNEDRRGWIAAIAADLNARAGACVLACSALNQTVRSWLDGEVAAPMSYVFLHGGKDLIAERLKSRRGHWFDPALLDSQFEALQPPDGAICPDIEQPVGDIVLDIIAALEQR